MWWARQDSNLHQTVMSGRTKDVIFDFANPAYAALLAAFRPSQQVFAGSDAAGTARGAALLAKWSSRNFQAPPLIAAPPCAIEGLHAYRNVWTKAVLER